jgi:hypothetical protein
MFKAGASYRYVHKGGDGLNRWTLGMIYRVVALVDEDTLRPAFTSNKVDGIPVRWNFSGTKSTPDAYWEKVASKNTKNLPAWW